MEHAASCSVFLGRGLTEYAVRRINDGDLRPLQKKSFCGEEGVRGGGRFFQKAPLLPRVKNPFPV